MTYFIFLMEPSKYTLVYLSLQFMIIACSTFFGKKSIDIVSRIIKEKKAISFFINKPPLAFSDRVFVTLYVY